MRSATDVISGSRGMVVTDLDGTLRSSDGRISETDLRTLRDLGAKGYLRAIATGRSLYSLWKIKEKDHLPIDYVIFSSGAGIFDYQSKKIIRKALLEAGKVKKAARLLAELNLDFMIHLPIPDNHHFIYYESGRKTEDFGSRRRLYKDVSSPFDGNFDKLGPGTQLIAIVSHSPSKSQVTAASVFEQITRALEGFAVIRTTSPLDGQSTWIEIFPKGVNKGCTTEWLAKAQGLVSTDVLSIGNDYNDLDLLEWAGTSFVVANAPPELKMRFDTVPSNDANGLSEAVRRWLSTKS